MGRDPNAAGSESLRVPDAPAVEFFQAPMATQRPSILPSLFAGLTRGPPGPIPFKEIL